MKKLLFVLLTSIVSINAPANDGLPSSVAVSDLQAIRNEYGYPVIKGVVTNLTNNPVKHVVIKFNLYDQQGNLIGNTLDIASNLEPRGRWVINAQSPKEFHTFKMTGVDAN